MENYINVISITISVFALFISAINTYISKKNLLANTIAENRMDWIVQVRNLVGLFLEKYIKQESKFELSIVKSKIDLYIIYDKPSYSAFEHKLSYCIENPYTESDYKELVELSQKVLNDVWVRIKMESGISRWEEKTIIKHLNAASKKQYKSSL